MLRIREIHEIFVYQKNIFLLIVQKYDRCLNNQLFEQLAETVLCDKEIFCLPKA